MSTTLSTSHYHYVIFVVVLKPDNTCTGDDWQSTTSDRSENMNFQPIENGSLQNFGEDTGPVGSKMTSGI